MSTEKLDRATLEQQVQLLTEQLQQAQMLTSLGELISTTTHEFNNVLMTIINYAKMGLRCQDEATRDKALEKILTASNKAARITNSILGMARNRSNGFEPTDRAKMIDDGLVLLEREMNKYRISVEREIGEVPEAQVNSNQIQQVLLNLLINARQAMPNGGHLLIKLQHDPSDNTIVLVVRDNGKGIPVKLRRKIFGRFVRMGDELMREKPGMGLGLHIVNTLVRRLNGRVRVRGRLDGPGTVFEVNLPAVAAEQQMARRPVVPPGKAEVA